MAFSFFDQIHGARDRYDSRFQQIFGKRLSEFWSNVTGFNVIKFSDEVVKPEEWESTSCAIRRQWGNEAVNVIRGLLLMDLESEEDAAAAVVAAAEAKKASTNHV